MFCELILSLWDYAAGACILQEAGGKITNDRGEDLDYTGSSAIVAVSRGVSGESYLPEGLPE